MSFPNLVLRLALGLAVAMLAGSGVRPAGRDTPTSGSSR